ncbi:hypothetical protein LCGC14_3107730 [marine sediment metagenome]|uniref:Uncharacterized protein n=1 Tax=marine sediment metagenome TaxID=412755 RepID=A0A0F8YDC8_9ZZZZ
MKQLMDDTWAIDADTDVIRCEDTGRYFLRQYQHEAPHDIRDSVSFDSRVEAEREYRAGNAVWEEWN